jgi:hypothetical protein
MKWHQSRETVWRTSRCRRNNCARSVTVESQHILSHEEICVDRNHRTADMRNPQHGLHVVLSKQTLHLATNEIACSAVRTWKATATAIINNENVSKRTHMPCAMTYPAITMALGLPEYCIPHSPTVGIKHSNTSAYPSASLQGRRRLTATSLASEHNVLRVSGGT